MDNLHSMSFGSCVNLQPRDKRFFVRFTSRTPCCLRTLVRRSNIDIPPPPSSLLFLRDMLTHIPSDRLLLLQRGGETVYFGDIGPSATVLTDYFARNGAVCPDNVNPAEYMLDAIGNGSRKRIGPKDWAEVGIHLGVLSATVY